MTRENEPLEQLREIRSLMERSTRFLSLSGWSGISVGILALLGSAVAMFYLGAKPFDGDYYSYESSRSMERFGISGIPFFILTGSIVFVLSAVSAYFFTARKANKQGRPLWDNLSRRMAWALALPLIVGGVVCLIMIQRAHYSMIAPMMLLFYGLGLTSASKYTHSAFVWLGYTQLVLGMIGLFVPGYGLELWALGFGVSHVIYGVIHLQKFD
jgi:hypothetical protein